MRPIPPLCCANDCLSLFRPRCVAPILLALLWGGAGPQAGGPASDPDGWQIAIVPEQPAGMLSIVPPPAPEPALAVVQRAGAVEEPDIAAAAAHGVAIIPVERSQILVNGRSYEDAYRSIPYNYTEYVANPGYRHDAAMELLFGALRPTTIHRHYEPEVIINQLPSPYHPYLYSHSERWQYRAPDFRLLHPGCCW